MKITLPVQDAFEYIRRMLPNATDEIVNEWLEDDANDEQFVLIGQIIALQVAFYVTRRTAGVDGSVCDSLGRMRVLLIREYESMYGEFIDFNKNASY